MQIGSTHKASAMKKTVALMMPGVRYAFIFTLIATTISLGSVVYMMQVYDRVVNSRSMETLMSLTVAVVFAYIFAEFFELIRKKILQKAAFLIDRDLSEHIFRNIHVASLLKIPGVSPAQLGDLRQIRNFLSSPAMVALLEVPTSIIFILVIFLINAQMGFFSLFGFVVQAILSWVNRQKVDPPLAEAQMLAMQAQSYAGNSMRNAQVIHAMGLLPGIESRWEKKQNEMLLAQAQASDNAGAIMAVSKLIQMFQGSMMLGFGCLLTIYGIVPASGSFLIVASILGGKALQPLMQLVGAWKILSEANLAYQRLDDLLEKIPKPTDTMPLPPPSGQLSVEGLVLTAPGVPQQILRGISFAIPAGSTLLVLGPSASGKSSLSKALMGVWPPLSGRVRLDGIDVYQWKKDELGPHVGYLPQEVELFDGTLADNIARFGEVDLIKVEEAAKLASIHDYVMTMPEGYKTAIGDEGMILSGGQRQRVGLARALYGQPKFIVLDEPNSSLDVAGEQALFQAIALMKSRTTTQVVITHRQSLIAAADYILMMKDGQVQLFGKKEEVLLAIQKANHQRSAQKVPSSAGGQL